MTAPRQVVAGAVYLVTRRCARREFLLKPSRTTNQVFLYVLALAARRFDIQIHAFCVLSNHFHLILTDPHALLPAFHQLLDALLARAVNASLGRWEHFWAPGSYSAVRLVSRSDVVEKAAYVLANPVAAGLVASGSAWPGLWSAPERIGGEAYVVKRPEHFFDPKGGLPGAVTSILPFHRHSTRPCSSGTSSSARSRRGKTRRASSGTAAVVSWASPACSRRRRRRDRSPGNRGAR